MGWKWLVIADDDTMLGVSKLLNLLNCYDADEEIVIGERYGFMVPIL
jgi:UDP-glucose:O-linked fucose beta-1,3-glucosyltransferase